MTTLAGLTVFCLWNHAYSCCTTANVQIKSLENVISIVWRNWIRLKLISFSYLPIDHYIFSRCPWKYHWAWQGRLEWMCFIKLIKFYLVSRKTFLLYCILTFHKVFLFFALQIIWGHTYFCLYCIILCCRIKHSPWHCRVAIQFKYCFPIIGLHCILISMSMVCSLEMPVPSQGHYGFHSFPVVDWFCLFIYLSVLTFPW